MYTQTHTCTHKKKKKQRDIHTGHLCPFRNTHTDTKKKKRKTAVINKSYYLESLCSGRNPNQTKSHTSAPFKVVFPKKKKKKGLFNQKQVNRRTDEFVPASPALVQKHPQTHPGAFWSLSCLTAYKTIGAHSV